MEFPCDISVSRRISDPSSSMTRSGPGFAVDTETRAIVRVVFRVRFAAERAGGPVPDRRPEPSSHRARMRPSGIRSVSQGDPQDHRDTPLEGKGNRHGLPSRNRGRPDIVRFGRHCPPVLQWRLDGERFPPRGGDSRDLYTNHFSRTSRIRPGKQCLLCSSGRHRGHVLGTCHPCGKKEPYRERFLGRCVENDRGSSHRVLLFHDATIRRARVITFLRSARDPSRNRHEIASPLPLEASPEQGQVRRHRVAFRISPCPLLAPLHVFLPVGLG